MLLRVSWNDDDSFDSVCPKRIPKSFFNRETSWGHAQVGLDEFLGLEHLLYNFVHPVASGLHRCLGWWVDELEVNCFAVESDFASAGVM